MGTETPSAPHPPPLGTTLPALLKAPPPCLPKPAWAKGANPTPKVSISSLLIPPGPREDPQKILPTSPSSGFASARQPPALPSFQFHATASFTGPPRGDNTGAGPGPGPMRHSRPLTAADLHLQLEKEQEVVVTRLPRQLPVLPAAQNASVVSNAFSAYASETSTEPGRRGDGLGASHYQPVRINRALSTASVRSFTAHVGSVWTTSLVGISSPAPERPGAYPPIAIADSGGISPTRQDSTASRRSRAGSPSPVTHSLATATMTTITTNTTTTASELAGILPATSRYEETALRRAEPEEVKRENEALRYRACELERKIEVLSHLHVSLVFLYHLSFCPDAMALIAHRFPWQVTADMLNALMDRSQWLTRLLEDGAPFPRSGGDEDEETARVGHWKTPLPDDPRRGGDEDEETARVGHWRPRPLPDDFALRGFQWAEKYFPAAWFKTEGIDDDDKYFEMPSMVRERKERVVWLGHRIAGEGRWLRFNKETGRFSLNPEYELQTGWVIVDHGELPDAEIVLRVNTD